MWRHADGNADVLGSQQVSLLKPPLHRSLQQTLYYNSTGMMMIRVAARRLPGDCVTVLHVLHVVGRRRRYYM